MKTKPMPIHHTEIKPIWATNTKFQSICMPTLKISDFRPAVKNQVNTDHPQNNEINFIPTLKSSQVRFPTLNEIKPIWTSHTKTSAHPKNE